MFRKSSITQVSASGSRSIAAGGDIIGNVIQGGSTYSSANGVVTEIRDGVAKITIPKDYKLYVNGKLIEF